MTLAIGLRIVEFVAKPLVARRFLDRVEVGSLDVFDDASSSAVRSSTAKLITGTSCNPARCAARQRRSPAMIS